jgi:hypothetical protein
MSRVSHLAMAVALVPAAVIFAVHFDAALTNANAQPPIAAAISTAPPIAAAIDAAATSPNAQPLIARAIEWRRRQPRFGLPRKEVMALYGHGLTRQLAIEANGEVQTFLDGGKRLITADSIAIRLIALAILSHPLDGPALKVRQPPGRYQRQPRQRTDAELADLRKGNRKRSEAAQKNREAKAAARSAGA